MAIFGLGKKKEIEESSAPGTPIDQITALKQRGMSSDQIIQEMERQGYNSSQIFEALNQANMGAGNPVQEPMGVPPTMPQQGLPQEQQPQQQFEQPAPAEPDKDQIEEVAEAIIDEKWKEFEDDIKVVIDWKDKTESRINRFEQQIKDLTATLNGLHKNIMGKISEYDRSITDVGVEIKAMEKVFQKILPSLTENVNKLDRIAKSSKPKK